jgi:DNA-binding NtrC family response regulator
LDDLEKLIQSDGDGVFGDRPVVVVIDDDASIRNSLELVLKEKYDVRTCVDGVDGVRAVDKNTCCVILDVRMPNHDGFWVCKHLRKREPDVPIIFHSAYQDLKDPYEVINEFHPFGYVVKGDTLATLLQLVAQAVKHSERVRDGRRTLERLRDAREQIQGVRDRLENVAPSNPRPSSRPGSVAPASDRPGPRTPGPGRPGR